MRPLDLIMRALTRTQRIATVPAHPNLQWRTALRFRHARTPDEERAFKTAFQVPGDALEAQPQFRAVALLAERLDSDADYAMVMHALTEAQLREWNGYRRALRAVLDTLRKEWDAAHPRV